MSAAALGFGQKQCYNYITCLNSCFPYGNITDLPSCILAKPESTIIQGITILLKFGSLTEVSTRFNDGL